MNLGIQDAIIGGGVSIACGYLAGRIHALWVGISPKVLAFFDSFDDKIEAAIQRVKPEFKLSDDAKAWWSAKAISLVKGMDTIADRDNIKGMLKFAAKNPDKVPSAVQAQLDNLRSVDWETIAIENLPIQVKDFLNIYKRETVAASLSAHASLAKIPGAPYKADGKPDEEKIREHVKLAVVVAKVPAAPSVPAASLGRTQEMQNLVEILRAEQIDVKTGF